MEISKRQAVKVILEIVSTIPQDEIPTTEDNSIDLEKFYELPESKAVKALFNRLGVDYKWLSDKGFLPAAMLYGKLLHEPTEAELEEHECSICKSSYQGFGNNAQPINDGRCCDECNDKVILARFARLNK